MFLFRKNFFQSIVNAFLLFLLVFVSTPLFATDDKAMQLAEAVYNRPAGKDSSAQVVMTLKSKKAKTRVRKLSIFNMDLGGSERWTLMRFSEPTDIKDTGLLTLDHPGDESDQWIYLPALDRVRLISSKRKGGRFVGSDFTYEDLRDREPDMDRHSLHGREKVGGVMCEKMVSIPVKKDNSIYSKRVIWIHKPSLTPLKIEFYKKGRKKPYKRLVARKLKKIQGIWTVLESTMYNLRTGSQTRLATQKIKYDLGLPKKLFSKRGLSDPGREKPYEL